MLGRAYWNGRDISCVLQQTRRNYVVPVVYYHTEIVKHQAPNQQMMTHPVHRPTQQEVCIPGLVKGPVPLSCLPELILLLRVILCGAHTSDGLPGDGDIFRSSWAVLLGNS